MLLCESVLDRVPFRRERRNVAKFADIRLCEIVQCGHRILLCECGYCEKARTFAGADLVRLVVWKLADFDFLTFVMQPKITFSEGFGKFCQFVAQFAQTTIPKPGPMPVSG